MTRRPADADETYVGDGDQERTAIHSTGCPSREQLELYAAGASDLREVADHLPRCPVCREIVARIAEDARLMGDFLRANRGAVTAGAAEPRPDGGIGEEVVPGFRIEGEIHRGGQGVVYRAIQLSTRRTVALKTMLQGRFATTRQRLRFEREVEIVASLRHPNIVTLYESGRTRDGLAFFAMELVAGRPLNEILADAERPPRATLLAMFIQLARAVAYAHRRGVIHRDLKPGNVLVDHDFAPHVLDFGLARTARGEEGGELDATVAGEFLGTFAYAAPEQLKGDPDLIDVRTDVFALGVILYEILAGERPWQTAGRGSIADLLLSRLEEAPGPPSALRPDVDADLDVIALKCLKGSPEERYQTADALIEDLERFLDGRPILARPDSFAYTVRKWVVRHKVATATVAGIALLVVGFGISFAVLYGLAETNRVRAERTLESFRHTLRSINPETGRGSLEMTALEFLDLVEEEASGGMAEEPLVAVNLLNTVEAIRLAFGDRGKGVERARRNLEYARGLAATLGRKEIPEVAEALHNLGRAHLLVDDLAAAEARYRESLATAERLFGRDSPRTALTLQHLASCVRRQNRLEEAEELYARTLAIQRAVHGAESEEVAAVLNGQAFVVRQRGDLGRALQLFSEATALVERKAGADDLRVGRGLASIARIRLELGQADRAIDDLRRASAIMVARLGPLAASSIETRRQLVLAMIQSGDGGGAAAEALALRASLDEGGGDALQRSRAAALHADALVAAEAIDEAFAAWRDAAALLAPEGELALREAAETTLRRAGRAAEADRVREMGFREELSPSDDAAG